MTRAPNEQLRLLLRAAGLSNSQFARLIVAVAAEHEQNLTCDRSTVSRWLAGHQPRPPTPTFLLEALTRRLNRPVTAQEAGLTRAPSVLPALNHSSGMDPVSRLALLTRAELDPGSSALPRERSYSLSALSIPVAESAGQRKKTLSSPAVRADAQVVQMGAMVTMFAEAAECHGGGSVRSALAAYLAHDVSRWLRVQAGDETSRRLHSTAAQLVLLLGAMSMDDGDHALAQHYQRIAAELAAEAADHGMLAIALRLMATHAYELGHHGGAVLHLMERSVAAAGRAQPITEVYARAQLSVIKAHHDRRAALAELARTERLYDQADSSPGAFTTYPPGALHYQRAQVFMALGDTPAAVSALNTSLRLRTPVERRASCLTRASLAETLLGAGHLDAALGHWGEFVSVYPALCSARATRRLRVMRSRLQVHRKYPPTATLLERAKDLV